MSEDNQIEIPQSFVELFVEPGRSKPSASRATIAERYELCEDMATLLTNTAQEMLHGLGIAETDVLLRCYQGMVAEPATFSAPEALWVVRRLAELSQWNLINWQAPLPEGST